MEITHFVAICPEGKRHLRQVDLCTGVPELGAVMQDCEGFKGRVHRVLDRAEAFLEPYFNDHDAVSPAYVEQQACEAFNTGELPFADFQKVLRIVEQVSKERAANDDNEYLQAA